MEVYCEMLPGVPADLYLSGGSPAKRVARGGDAECGCTLTLCVDLPMLY